jgi:hypothetical protein
MNSSGIRLSSILTHTNNKILFKYIKIQNAKFIIYLGANNTVTNFRCEQKHTKTKTKCADDETEINAEADNLISTYKILKEVESECERKPKSK